MGCEDCKKVSQKDYDECQKSMGRIEKRKETQGVKYTAPCGVSFYFGPKFTPSIKTKKRK